MTGPTFLTIATADYLPWVLTLNASLQTAYEGRARLHALHIGNAPALPPQDTIGLRLVGIEDLGIPTFWDMAFRYHKGALANALKPFFIEHVLREVGPRSLVFLDADSFVFRPLEEVHALLDNDEASIILTPHVDRPQMRTREPYEIDLLRHGVMNGGFVALRSDESARAFLAWWSKHLLTGCRYDAKQGYYGDQHWLDLVPALFDRVRVLRHRGYNAAYWNYPDRKPGFNGGHWSIGADPLVFFHHSQWRLARGESVREAMARLFCSDDPDLEKLLGDYHDRWARHAASLSQALSTDTYPFEAFSDGSLIPPIVRDAYARFHPAQPWTRDQLFGRGLALVMQQSTEVPVFAGIEMPELYVHIWKSRPDLKQHDLSQRGGQLAFMAWAVAHAAGDYGLPDEALAPARRSLDSKGGAQSAAALRGRLSETHSQIRAGKAGLPDLCRDAAALLQLFAKMLDMDAASAAGIDGGADFFRVFEFLRCERGPPEGFGDFEFHTSQIEAHGKYLAAKLDLSYRDLLASRPAIPEVMLEADAILNGGAALAEMLERWPDTR